MNLQIEAHYGHPVCNKHELLHLQAGAKLHVAVDKGSVDYRRFLQQLGITFGVC